MLVDPVPVDVDVHDWHKARTVPIENGLFICVVTQLDIVTIRCAESAVIADLSSFCVVTQYTVSVDILSLLIFNIGSNSGGLEFFDHVFI